MNWNGITRNLASSKFWAFVSATSAALAAQTLAFLVQWGIPCNEECHRAVWAGAFVISAIAGLLGRELIRGIALEDAALKTPLPPPNDSRPVVPVKE